MDPDLLRQSPDQYNPGGRRKAGGHLSRGIWRAGSQRKRKTLRRRRIILIRHPVADWRRLRLFMSVAASGVAGVRVGIHQGAGP